MENHKQEKHERKVEITTVDLVQRDALLCNMIDAFVMDKTTVSRGNIFKRMTSIFPASLNYMSI